MLGIGLNYTASTQVAAIWFVRSFFPPPPKSPFGRLRSMTQQTTASRNSGPLIITILVLVLLILHQDNWFWTDDTIVLGFMPIALFWHACISIAASLTWYLATKIAWPVDESPMDESSDQPHGEGGE